MRRRREERSPSPRPSPPRRGGALSSPDGCMRFSASESLPIAGNNSVLSRNDLRAPSPGGFALPTSPHRLLVNPKGIVSSSPGSRGTSYPGRLRWDGHQPQRGCVFVVTCRPQPRWDWNVFARQTQGSSCLATLGFGPESPWDSNSSHREVVGNDKPGSEGGSSLSVSSGWEPSSLPSFPSRDTGLPT